MQIFKNRPLGLFGVIFAVCAVLSLYLSPRGKICIALIAILLASLFLLLSLRIRRVKKLSLYGVSILLGVCLSLSSSYLYFDRYYQSCQQDSGKTVTVEGTVLERVYSNSFSSCFLVQLDSLNGEKSTEKIVLECEYISALQCGDRFSAETVQRDFTVTDEYDEESYYLSDGYTRILVCGSSENCKIFSEKDDSLKVNLMKWNDTLSRQLQSRIGGEEGGLAVALFLGNRSFLSSSTTLDFQRAGISHMLALSGMHVAILIAFLDFLLRKLHIAKVIRAIAVPTVLIGYLFLTGMSVSTVRAVLMMCILYLGFLLRADYDPFTALSAILAAIIFATPYAIFDLSLWMSFLAAASIIAFSPVIRSVGNKIKGDADSGWIRRGLSNLTEALLVGVVANAALLLLSAWVFGEISVASIPATVLLSFPMSGLLIFALLSFLFAGTPIFVLPCRILSRLMLACAGAVSDVRGVMLSVGSHAETVFLIAFTLVLILLAVLKIDRLIWFSAIPILMIGLFTLSISLTHLAPRSYFTPNEKRGDFYALCEGGEIVVVAVGDGFSTDAEEISAFAKEMRCSEIGDLVLTKYQDRQSYFISEVAERIKIRNLRLPMPKNEREQAIAKRLRQEAEFHGIQVVFDIDDLCIPLAGDPHLWQMSPPSLTS